MRFAASICVFFLLSCTPPSTDPTPNEEGVRGIWIDQSAVAGAGDGCFSVQLAYSVMPSVGGQYQSTIDVHYAWEDYLYSVENLEDKTVKIDAEGTFVVSESFTVCPLVNTQSVYMFGLLIEAKGEVDYFVAHPAMSYVRSSESFDRDLLPKIESLRESIAQGDNSPATLRDFWRNVAAYYKGGFQGLGSHITTLVSRDLRSAQVGMAGNFAEAFQSALSINGLRFNLSFSKSSGRVDSISLNESYQVTTRGYLADSIALIKNDKNLSVLTGIQASDEFLIDRDEESPLGRKLRYRRVANDVTVIPDFLTFDLIKMGNGVYYIDYIGVEIGDLGATTCDKAREDIYQENDLAKEPGMSGVEYYKFIARSGDAYRCVYIWYAAGPRDPVTGLWGDYSRIVDAINGEVLYDNYAVQSDGFNTDTHHVEIATSVPYSTDQRLDSLTRVPYGVISAIPPTSQDPQDAVAVDLDFSGDFHPLPDFSDIMGENDIHGAYKYMFIPWAGRLAGTPNTYNFNIPLCFDFGLWAPSLTANVYCYALINMTWADLLVDNSVDDTFDFSIDLLQDTSTDEGRAIASTTNSYFIAQYKRHILEGLDSVGNPVWGGPNLRCDDADSLVVNIYNDPNDPYGGGFWSSTDPAGILRSGTRVNLNIHGGWFDLNGTTFAHEMGHWAANIRSALGTWQNKEGGPSWMLGEGYADYFSTSTVANYIAHRLWGSMQHDPLDPQHRYQGNELYHQAEIRYNTPNIGYHEAGKLFSTMFMQYMNMIGNKYSDSGVHRSYRRWSTTGNAVNCRASNLDWAAKSTLGRVYQRARYLMRNMPGFSRDFETSSVPDAERFWRSFRREAYQAGRQHGWHLDSNLSSNQAQYYAVSSSPSHAVSVTPTSSGPTVLNTKYDRWMETKWVNFYASGNVTYIIGTTGNTDQMVELYSTSKRDDTAQSTLQWLARSKECTADTDFEATSVAADVSMSNGATCANLGLDPNDPLIKFTPKRSGFFYAMFHADVPGDGQIFILPISSSGGLQETSTTAGQSSNYSIGRERALGQSIPVSLRPEELTSLKRRGTFSVSNERHFWRFQYYPVRKYFLDYGEFAQDAILQPMYNSSYTVVVERPDDGTNVELALRFRGGPYGSLQTLSLTPPLATHSFTVQGGMRTDRWRIELRRLVNVPDFEAQRAQNLYVELGWGGGSAGMDHHQYNISVESFSANNNVLQFEDDTNLFNPFVIERWCGWSDEGLPANSNYFTIHERLGHEDADYIQVFLQEGEQLNVTYRGREPAALDADGPTDLCDDTTGAWVQGNGQLNYLWQSNCPHGDNSADPNDNAYHTFSGLMKEWRPVIERNQGTPTIAEMCDTDAQYANCDGQYYAQRGYLWSFNKCSAASCQNGPFIGDLWCGNVCDDTRNIPIGPDNAVNLSLNAFVSGMYTIRVRGQNDAEAYLNGHYTWNPPGQRERTGAPYTLSLNIGVYQNKIRPHWQYLQDNNPIPPLTCGRRQ